MQGLDDPGALNDFLHRFLDDRERGAVQEVGAYLALFPGSDTAIVAEYAALMGGPTEAGAGADEGPTQIGCIACSASSGTVRSGSSTVPRTRGCTARWRSRCWARAELETERERFEREAAIASWLDHPGICTVYEIARHGLWTCIAMRCVPEETLAARLARCATEPLPSATAIALIEKVARALRAAHSAGVVHRDVKAGNITVTPDGEPVVVDFGLARDTNSGAGSWSAGLDRSGSPSYMAPEQVVAGIGPVDARTDVWALGVTLYECLAGVRPFEASTQAALFDAILRREPAPLRSRATRVSRDLEVVVAMAMAKEPAARYQAAQAFVDDLARVQRGEPVQARPIGRLGKVARWARRNPAVASPASASSRSSACRAWPASGWTPRCA
jgi:serine/threonine protein kinase